jgi:hypothetical protein
VLVTPVSSAAICWVLTAILTASSVGSASASSREFVCRDWVPPRMAASASKAVLATLLYGSWAVSDARGLGVEAHAQGALVFGPVLLPEHGGPDAPRGAELADLLEKVYVRVEEEREARREVVHVQPRLYAGFHVGEAVGEREGELLCAVLPASRMW